MASQGYDTDRFVGTEHEAFHCLFCLNVAKDPFQCQGCGKLVCKVCITGWIGKNPEFKCPNRCTANSIIPISRALQKIYRELNIKCSNDKCNKVIKLGDLPPHEAICLTVKCWNYEVCERPQSKEVKAGKPCCSEVCNTLMTIKDKFNDKKAVYDCLGAFMKLSKSGINVKPVSGGSSGLIPMITGFNSSLVWDPAKTGGGIAITENGLMCFLKEQAYLFRTTLTNQGFTGGVHYWEIIADSRTENELKIGVTTNKDFDYNSAFCDHPFGFAYYGLGQLRHSSNASGVSYGKKFKKEGVLGVCLNMNTGVLAFSLNGEYMGVAFKDNKLTVGPVFPAVALLHCAGCKIRSGLPVPAYFKD